MNMNMNKWIWALGVIIARLEPGKVISVMDHVDLKYHALRSAYGNFKKNDDGTYTDDIDPAYKNLTLNELMDVLYDFMTYDPCFNLYIDDIGYIKSEENKEGL